MQFANSISRTALVLALGLSTFAAQGAFETAHAQASEAEDETIVVTGTRGRARSLTESPVPVDVLSSEDLRRSGAVSDELGQALAVLTPSFNFPRQSNSGSSDHVRGGQLRGLSPDQLLVLVNGRRRHTSAIVNSETKIGRGAAAVDFNTIPLSAVRRIEVLRDGAGAQYGSDAIAGVVNVILDDRASGAELAATYGAHVTDLDPIGRSITDGETFTIDASMGLPLGDGFLRFGGDFETRDATNRAGFDQIPFFVAPTPANLALHGQRNYAEGDPEVEDWNLWFNAASRFPFGEVYGFGTYGERDTIGITFFRYPDSFDNVAAIYPQGFRPESLGFNEDLSLTAGLRSELGGWELDTSVTFGRNEFEYGVQNSLNASLGAASPTRFRSGAFTFEQASVNADLVRSFDTPLFHGPLTLAFGAEFRNEAFESERGEPASYEAGPFDLAIGAQGAPGLTPDDGADIERDVWSFYGELGADLTERLFVEAAARYEDYSDFGEEATGKIALLYRLTDDIRLRGAISNSVRAPALQQIGFSDTTLNFGVGRTLVRTRTLPVDNTIAQSLGAKALNPETSVNFSLGATARLTDNLTLTIDAFRIEVDDRITLSDRFFGPAFEAFVQAEPGGGDIQSVRFFTNAIDTETEGVDIVLSYARPLFSGELELSAAYTYATTDIARFAPTPAALTALDPSFALIGVEEINTIEEAAPNSKLILSAAWSNETWRVSSRLSRLDSTVRVFNFGGGFEPRQEYGTEYQLDGEAEYHLNAHASIAFGGANLLDEYPDRSSSDINFFGNLPYDILSPVGVNGRYLYGRIRIQY
ncbi:MAG TPA: TonB-dependent receptor [Hyphomonadaceae bacterium]|nr:TonB-dependent receptor [Hyphomonadaceae bacterium]